METVPAPAPDDNAGTNPNSVKSDDSSPPHESGCGSPPPNCAICLGTCRNKSFTDSCLHQFCFKCLLTWSKVKAECPLCKQNFKSIIHNVRSNHQYEEYMVEQRQSEENLERIDIDNFTTATRRFRYRTTFTLPRRETMAIQQLLLHYPMMADVVPLPGARAPPTRRRRSPTAFRRTVYRHNLWARTLPDFTGRFRDCSPEFYRFNNTQMHRLVPWLNRELLYLLNENVAHISYVMARILDLLPQYHINSPEFREAMQRYFGNRTEHFLHELYCFASTPYDLTGYDRNVQYTTDTRISTMVNEVLSSSDSDASVDSDIVMVSSSEPAEPPPGPSRLPTPAYPQNFIPQPSTDNVIPIETISHSDTDDDSSEVMVVGYIKPPQDRTPEVVDLLGSDSDVIVQDTTQPEPSQSTETQETRPNVPLVKLSLKRHMPPENADTDSESSTYQPPPPRTRRRRARAPGSATTSDTCRTTPSPASSTSYSLSTSVNSSRMSSETSSSISADDNYSDTSSTSSSSSDRRKRASKKKSRRKTSKETVGKDKKKRKKRTTHLHHKDRKSSHTSTKVDDKRNKSKSHSGKGVKSSKKSKDSINVPPTDTQSALDQPSTSACNNVRRKPDRVRKSSRSSRESKRLKSVVNVMNGKKNSDSRENSVLLNALSSAILNPNSNVLAYTSDSGSIPGEDRTRRVNDVPPEIIEKVESCFNVEMPIAKNMRMDNSDSEDDLPLNLTVKKTCPSSSL